ncbi:MAG: hypothetical protein EXQ96_04910 [Alphaproteobacteria bacterium]|nr:hypothetical protein [Alphaproteobacteria bacterium]
MPTYRRASLRGAFAATALILFAALPAFAADAPLGAFFGRWQGTGIAQTPSTRYFGETVRDLDVTLKGEGTGFSIEWTTILRERGDPNDPRVQRKATRLRFVAAGPPGLFRAEPQGEPITNPAYTWAQLAGNTLALHLFQVTETGGYEIQVWRRRLTGEGMELNYLRLRDDEDERSVSGRLIRIGS